MQALRASGRRLILVSGRERQDLLRVFASLHLFDRVILENGALLIRPAEADGVPLGDPPPPSLVENLRRRGVSPLSTGEVIISSWEPNETAVLESIRELGLEYQVIFNKGAVMVLPPGINKATGLRAALKELQLSPHNVVGIGDAENDQSFLQLCGCSVAVANALPSVKETSDIVTAGARGNGVREIAARLIENDLADVTLSASRHRVVLADNTETGEVILPPRGASVLVAGSSGSGKSTLIQAVLERLIEREYQYCVIDPEGDYEHLPATLVAGSREHAPDIEQVIEHLEKPDVNLAVNLLAIPLADRPAFFTELLSALLGLRVRLGRPHWTVVDEAHHMLPAADAPSGFDRTLGDMIFVTVHPDQLAVAALSAVGLVIAVGAASRETIEMFCRQLGRATPPLPDETPCVKLRELGCERRRRYAAFGRRGCHRPGASKDAYPGAGEDANGMGMIAASVASALVDVCCPGGCVSGVVGEAGDGPSAMVACPAEDDTAALAGGVVTGRRRLRRRGSRRSGSVGAHRRARRGFARRRCAPSLGRT